ncbi:MAG: GspE/PulE family protein [Acidimicrobiales bacterium]
MFTKARRVGDGPGGEGDEGDGRRGELDHDEAAPPASPFGRLLVDSGVIAESVLDQALSEQMRTGRSLGRVLVESGMVQEIDLVTVLASHLGLEFVDLGDYPVDPTAAALVNEALARRYQALPIGFDNGKLVLAMADPGNIVAVDDIRTMTGREIKVMVATRSGIMAALDRYQRLDGDAGDLSAQAAREFEAEDDLSAVREVVEDAPIVKLVNLMITQGVSERASDVHVEPGERDVRVRYRIDGVLHEAMRLQRSVHSGVVSRLKIMADIDIAERRVPQDGRVSATIAGKPVDLRVATLPTVYGEKVVLRILDKSTALLQLVDLGFLPEALERFAESYRKPYGTVLVTGPTGSGKSTTLYATLNQLNQDDRNVITVEDPVEYRLAGINQVQVNTRSGLTFAAALRSILRSDPDIVLVGEIRDTETARIAVEAALTGHLWLSTLHTNDAASTPTRLVEMGVEPFLVASSVDCIVAQRLARRLCERCKEPYRLDRGEIEAMDLESVSSELPVEVYRAVGCGSCGRTGYRGRFGVHEVMTVTEEIERMIVDRSHSEDLRRTAVEQGMWTLRRTGLTHVLAGRSTFEEILRVVG